MLTVYANADENNVAAHVGSQVDRPEDIVSITFANGMWVAFYRIRSS